jgi:hypothetical protein
VRQISAEEAARAESESLRGRAMAAVARALAPPERSWALLEPLLRAGGLSILFFGAGATLPPRATVWEQGIAIIRREGGPAPEGGLA